jgi:hypothetical protein
MNGVMTLVEIERSFDSEWVLVGDPEYDAQGEVVRGTVLFHGKNRDEMYQRDTELRPRSAAYVYTGSIPDNVAFAL